MLKKILDSFLPASVFLISLWVATPVIRVIASETTYYVSSSTGNDNDDGESSSTPWCTLSKASGIIYKEGDQLLLKCGDSWNETLILQGNGIPENPVTISSYGSGARPYIYKSITNIEDRCIKLNKAMGYRFIGLELGMAWYGIEITMDRAIHRAWDYYYIEDCYFHDMINTDFPHSQVHGADLSGWPWAIYKRLDSSSDGCILTNLTIKNSFSNRCQGIYNTPWSEAGSGVGSISQQNILFDQNTFQNCYFNAIYTGNSTNFDLTNNEVVYGYPNKSEWPYGNAFIISGSPSADKPMSGSDITGNEFGWAGDVPGGVDGCFYDYEYSQSGTNFRFNFCHDAFGEGFLVMGYCNLTDISFSNNVITDFCQYSSRRNYAFDFSNKDGTGTIANNLFFCKPGQIAFNHHPEGYTFKDNNENATGIFVNMPEVSNITSDSESRQYTFTCKTSGANMRYTIDGSVPTPISTLYTGSIRVSKSCAINVRGFAPEYYPSRTNSIIADLREEGN